MDDVEMNPLYNMFIDNLALLETISRYKKIEF